MHERLHSCKRHSGNAFTICTDSSTIQCWCGLHHHFAPKNLGSPEILHQCKEASVGKGKASPLERDLTASQCSVDQKGSEVLTIYLPKARAREKSPRDPHSGDPSCLKSTSSHLRHALASAHCRSRDELAPQRKGPTRPQVCSLLPSIFNFQGTRVYRFEGSTYYDEEP